MCNKIPGHSCKCIGKALVTRTDAVQSVNHLVNFVQSNSDVIYVKTSMWHPSLWPMLVDMAVQERALRMKSLSSLRIPGSEIFFNLIKGHSKMVELYRNNDVIESYLREFGVDDKQSEMVARHKRGDDDENITNEQFDVEFITLLTDYYHKSFFKWVNMPRCSNTSCSNDDDHNMTSVGSSPPTPAERSGAVRNVECYQCNVCHQITRFPRYNHPQMLLKTRCGRCGERANTMACLLNAVGYSVRLVSPLGEWHDHVWVEVYIGDDDVTGEMWPVRHWIERLSAARRYCTDEPVSAPASGRFRHGRWMHLDPGEGIDKPLMYETGWKRDIAYVVSIGHDDVIDVTRRYIVNNESNMSRRTLVPERWLDMVMTMMRLQRLRHVPPHMRNVRVLSVDIIIIRMFTIASTVNGCYWIHRGHRMF